MEAIWAQLTELTLGNVGTSLALILMFGLLMSLLWKVSKDDTNEISCWQLIASRGLDGRQYMDPKKIGYLLGAFGGFWLCVRMTYTTAGLDVMFFATWLTFLAGIDIFTTFTKGKLPQLPTNVENNDNKTP